MNILRIYQQILRFCIASILACLLALNPALMSSAIAHPSTEFVDNRTNISNSILSDTVAVGFHVSGRYLLDSNGNNFIMRGINHLHTWWPTQTSSFANIKNKRANTIRVVLSNGIRDGWTKNSVSDVANVINLCKINKLICVLEVHDTTGYGEQAGAASLAEAVNYWKEIKSVLIGQEAYVIINIGNEPYGNFNVDGWINDTKNAIAEMRNAGFQHTLMVDAPNWGQDWEFIMRDNATNIFNSDPLRNTVFSIHMYEVFDTPAPIQNYVSTFVNAGLPLVIGEFGPANGGGPGADIDAVMATAQANGIGYLGWAWSGAGPGLDMVTNFDPDQETWWGNRIINGENGIARTSRQASVYGTFEDVSKDYWAWDFIERLYRAGITGGCSSNPLNYCPEQSVTRAQMAVFLEKGIWGSSFTAPNVSPTFTDTVGHWAENWIEALRSDGITGGCGTNLYCPEDPVTRTQMAIFLLKAKYGMSYTPPAVGSSTGFTDVPSTHWAAPWIKQLAAEGITGGCGTGIYCPESPVTRAQMAVFLVRTFNLP